jgi:hypothetical protein
VKLPKQLAPSPDHTLHRYSNNAGEVTGDGAGKRLVHPADGRPSYAAASGILATAGFDVWTPVRVERRAGRGRQRKVQVELSLPITPTFVFARADHVAELLRMRALPVSPHPAFSLLRHRGDIPFLAEAALHPCVPRRSGTVSRT